uniref:MICAL-like protein 1 n=1 Tax=Semicossyphus pulcher TaxID=241346 RepID=UPI0037E96244
MASPKALWDWCCVTCASYPNVEIRNMQTSFRDGLVFCAIIHKHRPDLIDFSSLSKDNVYQNNKLAFEVAEMKLGIPALLDPNDMVSSKVPDCLSIITYLSQYYHFFNKKSHASPVSLKSSHVTVFNNLTKRPGGLKRCQSFADLKTSAEYCLSNTRPQTVCSLCFKPVHLIQRHLINWKVYHRSCFRCKVCHSSLLPGLYTQGSDAGFLFCTYHITDSKSAPVDLNKLIESTENQPRCNFEEGYFSLGGLPISSVPHYPKKTESQDGLVCETAETEWKERQECSREKNRDFAFGHKSAVKKQEHSHLPSTGVQDRAVDRAGKAGPAPLQADCESQPEVTQTQEPSEHSSPRAQAAEGNSRPVPAPRRMLDPSAVPVPAPRTKAQETTNSSPAAGNANDQKKCSPSSSRVSTSGSPKVRTSHPWLTLVHPGPWTQLPPAPPPVPAPRSRYGRSWYRPRFVPPNPFAEEMEEETKDEGTKPERAGQTKRLVAAVPSESGDTLTEKSGGGAAVVCSGEAEGTVVLTEKPDVKDTGSVAAPVPVEEVVAVTLTVGTTSEPDGDVSQGCVVVLNKTENTGCSLQDVTEAAAGLHVASDQAQRNNLPRSLSVPAITSSRCHSSSVPDDFTAANECVLVTSSQSKLACKENPFDRKTTMRKSKTYQSLPSRRAPAPGHGFPLIKRKVQSDQNISTDNLRVEMRELDKHLQTLEQRGVVLERNLRDCKNDKEEEKMLIEWFSLVHERNVLVRRDTELVYLTKQQKLEERQADVEYLLRCLLNKPENDWSKEDRAQEQQLMDELVAIIEQRNQIISSLDQDRMREREEDVLLEAIMKDKELQKEGIKDLKRSKGKFNPTKMFKMLNQKAESTNDNMDRKS